MNGAGPLAVEFFKGNSGGLLEVLSANLKNQESNQELLMGNVGL
jgi:hypothetical protein